MRSILFIENNINKATNSLPPHMIKNFLDCMRTSSPPAPVSEHKAGSRYLLASGHGRYLITKPPSPASVPSPASSPPSPIPVSPSKKGLSLPPDMFVPFPSPPRPHSPAATVVSQPQTYGPTASPPNNGDDKQLKTILVAAAAAVSVLIIVVGMSLCYREAKTNKVDKDDSPLLILTSKDYTGGMLMFGFLQ